MSRWTVRDIPSQTGKFAIVTGANSGVGFDTALELARAGAEVIVASRAATKAEAAVAKIRRDMPSASIGFELLDLASLASVAAFAARIRATHQSVDILINNAGVMAPPKRQVTADGFELQIGTNYLGHFALTAHLLPALSKAKARVVQLASIAHKRGRIDFADLSSQTNYRPYTAYSQSKLAMLMFALELQRRSDAAGWGLTSLAAHPGVARTELVPNGPGAGSISALGVRLIGPFLTQSAAAGALPSLFAATAPQVTPGGYYGSQGLAEMKGPPGVAKIAPQALDVTAAKRLWDESETLTKVKFVP